jgi:hypothetical protein
MSEVAADNMAIWSKVEMTNPKDTKPFQRSGGFSGTAICPMSIAKRATELFGPLGIGWGIEELETKIEGTDEKKIWFAHVKVWYLHPVTKQKGEITQWGATEFIGKRSSGAFIDEEAAKKSVTDGWTKCMSMLGFSADVHLGKFDDSKYVNDARKRFDEAAKAEAAGKSGSTPTTTGKPDAKPEPPKVDASKGDTKRSAPYMGALKSITAADTFGRCREIRRNVKLNADKFIAGEVEQLNQMLDDRENYTKPKHSKDYVGATAKLDELDDVPGMLKLKANLRDERRKFKPGEIEEVEQLIDRKCLTIPQAELQNAA